MSTQISVPVARKEPQVPSNFSLAVKMLSMPLLLLGFAAFMVISMLGMEVSDNVDFPGPRFFPAVIAGGMIILGLADLAMVLRQLRQPITAHSVQNTTFRDGDPADEVHEDAVSKLDLFSLVWCLAGFIVFTFALNFLGWILAAGLLFWCVAHAFGAKRHLHSAVVGLTLSSLTYLAFSLGLGLPLPTGFLGGVL